MHMQFWYANLKERGHLKDLGVGRRIILQHILPEIWLDGVNWIAVAQTTDRWRIVVNMVMNFRSHEVQGISWLAQEQLVSQKALYPMELVRICVYKVI